jgi:hypothetical protein
VPSFDAGQRLNPYPSHYRLAFARFASGLLYPLFYRLALRLAFPKRGEHRARLRAVDSQGETKQGGWPLYPGGELRCRCQFGSLTGRPSCLLATVFGHVDRQPLTLFPNDETARLHSRSPVCFFPGPLPRCGWQVKPLSQRLRTPPLPATHATVGTPGHTGPIQCSSNSTPLAILM